jgi:hypothetical protein
MSSLTMATPRCTSCADKDIDTLPSAHSSKAPEMLVFTAKTSMDLPLI